MWESSKFSTHEFEMSTSRRRPLNPPPKPKRLPPRPPNELENGETQEPFSRPELKSSISKNFLTFGGRIGLRVLKGKLKGVDVAVTTFLDCKPSVLTAISGLLHHPNVLHMIGMILEDRRCFLVNELAWGGSLHDFIHRKKRIPSTEMQFQWMKDVALGMEFLHNCGIIHCDLRSAYVMLGHENCMTAKIRLWEGCRLINDQTKSNPLLSTSTPNCIDTTHLVLHLIAPEVAMKGSSAISQKSDIYSYSMMVYELLTLELPFKGILIYKALLMVTNGERPSLPEKDCVCQPFLRRLISDCWAEDVNIRPTFKDIVNALFLQEYPIETL